jgi:hypothetical protein
MESSDVGISKKSLTQIIKTGLLQEPKQSAHQVLDCFTCGRPYLYKGPKGDDSGRFVRAAVVKVLTTAPRRMARPTRIRPIRAGTRYP